MTKDQQNATQRTLLGLEKATPPDKPKNERILETINRMISRIKITKGHSSHEADNPLSGMIFS